MKRYFPLLALSLLLIPGTARPASKEQQEMQRDIAQLQDQVRMLQSTQDQKLAAIQTLIQQALDAGNKANTSVSVLSASVTQTLERELKDALRPVAGLGSKVDNVSNDVAEVKNQVADLTTHLNRMQQQLTDINNAIKVLQTPPAPPPPNPAVDGAAKNVPPPAQTIFNNASNDYASGKSDLAAGEFSDFVKFYPDDPRAPEAQFYLGLTHYSQQKYDEAVEDFDAVLERFPENTRTPDAYFMKGKALKDAGHRDMAATEFRALIKKFPRTDQATKAAEQLRAMGLSATAPASAAAKKKR